MREQIRERFGSKAAKEYKASLHVMSLRQWSKFGVRVKPGESSLKTYTLIEDSQAEAGEEKRVRRSVPVFHYLQTDLVPNHE